VRYCRVVGPLWATVKHPGFAGRSLFVVQPLDDRGGDTGPSFIAVDHAQAGIGDRVIVISEGSGTRQVLAAGELPIRSLIVGIVDRVDSEPVEIA
jgi:microcompartment protein CcmK/EutM